MSLIRIKVFFFLLNLIVGGYCFAAEKVAVIYPEMKAPYVNIFGSIIEGLDAPNHQLKVFALNRDNQSRVFDWLGAENPSLVIALGNTGFQLKDEIPTGMPVILGAVKTLPPNMSGVSLNISPEKIMLLLKSTTRPIDRLYVVYSQRESGWWIQLALQAAKSYGIELVAYQAESLKSAMNAYREIFDKPSLYSSALWLPMDSVTVTGRVVVPYILQESWDRKLLVLSTKPSYTKRGLLAAVFADNVAMAQTLYQVAEEAAKSKKVIHQTVGQLRYTLNLRTADHLGIDFSESIHEQVDIYYPAGRMAAE